MKPVISFHTRVEHLEHVRQREQQVKNVLRSCADAPRSRARLMVRTQQEILMQPIPPSTTLSDLGVELKLVGMQSPKCDNFLSHLSTGAPTISSVAQLLQMKDDDVKILEAASEFSVTESLLLRYVLGCPACPFQFAKSSKGQIPPGEDESDGSARSNVMMKSSGAKGGAMRACSGELTTRREPIQDYYPPSEFDMEAKGSLTRNNKRLRKKIVKEFEDYCGHLYPSKEEKDIMLAKIQELVGPPDNGRSWNYWFSTTAGGVVTKHKGMAITDLEKARRDPAAYGCHGTAVDGQLRPARPVRPVPVIASLQTPDATNSRNSDSKPAGELNGIPPSSQQAAEDAKDTQTEEAILATAKAASDEVERIRQEADQKRKVYQQRQKDDREAKKRRAAEEKQKMAKPLAAKAANTDPVAKPKAAGGTKRKRGAAEASAEEDLSDYEKQKNATTKSNKEWLDFLDKVFDKNCKILDKKCKFIQDMTTSGFSRDK